jgi:hypothetical protein
LQFDGGPDEEVEADPAGVVGLGGAQFVQVVCSTYAGAGDAGITVLVKTFSGGSGKQGRLHHLQQARGKDHVQADLLDSGNVEVVVVEDDERQRDGIEVAHNTQGSNDEVQSFSWRASVLLLPVVVVAHPVGFQRSAD